MSLENDIIDLMATANARGVEISEITLDEDQVDALHVYGRHCSLGINHDAMLIRFNGARVVVRPEPKKTLATQLRALADQVEKLL